MGGLAFLVVIALPGIVGLITSTPILTLITTPGWELAVRPVALILITADLL
jgi:hypothetical protein